MEELILFIFSFMFLFLIYQFFIIKKAKKSKKKKHPIEVNYLVTRYNLDLKKVNYNQLLQIVAITSSFDVACIVSIVLLFENFFLSLFIGFISIFVIIIISYHLVYLFYKKKGMIKSE